METYWNNLGENNELNLIKWMRRFTNEIIFKISTGVKNDAVFSYYSTFMPEKSFNEKERKKIKDSEDFIQSIETFISGMIYFSILIILFVIMFLLFVEKLLVY